jgi:hypothetical protein
MARQFFTQLETQEALKVLEPREVQKILFSLLTMLHDSPNQLRQILSELSEGRFGLNTYVSETPQAAHSHNQRVRLLVTSVLSVSVALLLSIPELPRLWGVSLAWPLSTVLGLLYLWMFMQWRRLS